MQDIMEPGEDRVDQVRAAWARVRPDIDTSPVAVVARIGRAARFLDDGMNGWFATHGLTRVTWDILATLRRSGPPYRCSPTALYRAVMRSSGAMTRQLDNLERAGWVTRIPDPSDRRGLLVQLTPGGLELVDRIAAGHVENETRMLHPLTPPEQEQLASLLRKLLIAFEHLVATPDHSEDSQSATLGET
jgi:DNA-binding MarR family transcriptional regulator